jgi:hypothetical protein
MERKPGGKDGEVFIYRSLNAVKYYLALSANQVNVGTVQYSWTIEQPQTQGSFLYVKLIMLHIIPHRHGLEI